MKSERYGFEKAQQEAGELKKKVESGEATSYAEAEQKIEHEGHDTELTLEQIEKILEKVVDINMPGLAYTFVDHQGVFDYNYDYDRFVKILKEGVLGHVDDEDGDQGAPDVHTKERWAKKARARKPTVVHFNIVGRAMGMRLESRSAYDSMTEIQRSYQHRFWRGGAGILFSLDRYNEIPHRGRENYSDVTKQTGSYTPSALASTGESQEGVVITEFGFILFPRVSPGDFKGIFIVPVPDDEMKKSLEKWVGKPLELVWVQEIRKLYPELDIPAYLTDGSLVWPKKMSYEEVKQYVAEREAKSKNRDDT